MQRLRPAISTFFPYTTLFRSAARLRLLALGRELPLRREPDQADEAQAERERLALARRGDGRRPRRRGGPGQAAPARSEEHTSELQSHHELVCRPCPE